MPQPTKAETAAALNIMLAVTEAIRGLKEVPSGVLYANLMGKLSLEAYQKIIGMLERNKLIEVTSSHVIRWTGPKLEG